MKRIAALAIFSVFFRVSLFSADWTNTVLTNGLKIRSYKVVSFLCSGISGKRLITREIETDTGKKLFYYIDTATFRFGLTDTPGKVLQETNAEGTELGKIFSQQEKRKRPFGSSQENFPPGTNKNIVLTTDLCPTTNGFDRQFYSNLQSLSSNRDTPMPVTVFFSGLWVRNHAQQLDKIKKSGLDFTAGNHTLRHDILTNRESLARFTSELTNTEVILLQNGILPSYFFRFPGLVYHDTYMKELGRLSLIAVNANVWMGTKSKNWGVLLVHSNGCASSEVRIFSKFLKFNLVSIRSGKTRFRDIYSFFRASIDAETGKRRQNRII